MHHSHLIVLIVGLGVAPFVLLYLAIPNLRQARKLKHPVDPSELDTCIGDVVVVHGVPEPLKELFMRRARNRHFRVLWLKIEQQEKVSSGRRSHWATVRTILKKTDFWLHFPDGGRIYVHCRPTEVQDAARQVSGGGLTTGSSRSVQSWLPLVPELTVMGKLIRDEEGEGIEPDGKMGLFFSASPPGQAAQMELYKGYAQLAAAVACAAGCVGLAVFFLSHAFKP